jgi:antitoxin (DNA-binding transcriptional repressor) of toxin-antitoxin stability system
MQNIEFICDPALIGLIPKPVPAGRMIPEWFRRLDRDLPTLDAHGLQGLTAKACLPFVDAMSLGFVIPLPVDITVYADVENKAYRFNTDRNAPFEPIGDHSPDQLGAPAEPHASAMPFKFINPWQIIVPEGYSILFTQPINHAELPFAAFTGLVDCDGYSTTVNIPFLWTAGSGRFVLNAGTPIAQIIPLKRSDMRPDLNVRAATQSELKERSITNEKKYGSASTYAREWRAKK